MQDVEYAIEQVELAIELLYNELNPWYWTCMFHLLRHMPQQIFEYGPVRENWMFSTESLFGVEKGKIRSRSHPEENLMRTRDMRQALEMARVLLRTTVNVEAGKS
jgi:hypothetical protein